MSKTAMKLALEALETRGVSMFTDDMVVEEAITALRQALEQPAQTDWEAVAADQAMTIALLKAEQPAQDVPETNFGNMALNKMAENARELGLDYEPVCNKDPQGCWNVRCQLGKKCKNTSAQQEPVARQYQNRDGVWKDFISEKHYKDTLEDGSWPIRNLYTKDQL